MAKSTRKPIPPLVREMEMKLAHWAPVTPRPMFGAFGLYIDDTLFAFVIRDVVYFKTDPKSRDRYDTAGMAPLSYTRAEGRVVEMSYSEVPPSVLADPIELGEWAEQALSIARKRKSKTPTRR